MRHVSKCVVVGAAVSLVLSLGSCWWWVVAPEVALVGTWEITEKPDNDAWSPHAYLVFTIGVDQYRMLDDNRSMFEVGSITNLTHSSFDCVIETSTDFPEWEGSQNYAEYSLSGSRLSLTFFDDDTKAVPFGTIVAERTE